MEIDDTFRIDVPIDEAWRVLSDVGRIAAFVPGTELHEVKGDEYHGVVEVKVGALTAQYQGTVRVESADPAAHTAIIVGTGRDAHGQGNASATIEVTLLAEGNATRVDLDADLSLTGKVAQFGRGVVADVSKDLVARFAENLRRDLLAREPLANEMVDLTASEAAESAATTTAAPEAETEIPDSELGAGESSDAIVAEAVAAGAEPAAAPSGNGAAVKRAEPAVAAPAELLESGGTSLVRRVAPVVGFVVAAVVVRRLLRRRHR
jgi:carbon monoxide dehydrogenase subunit G